MIGYYDASVVVTALAKAGVEASQHDHRTPLSEEQLAQVDRGVVINMQSTVREAWSGMRWWWGGGLRLFRDTERVCMSAD